MIVYFSNNAVSRSVGGYYSNITCGVKKIFKYSNILVNVHPKNYSYLYSLSNIKNNIHIRIYQRIYLILQYYITKHGTMVYLYLSTFDLLLEIIKASVL